MVRILALTLCSLILLPALLMGQVSPEIQAIARQTPVNAEDYESFYFLWKDNPERLERELHQLWDAARQNHDFRLEAQVGWFIARIASFDLKTEANWDMDRLFKDTIQLIKTHRLPLSTMEIEFFEISYRASLAVEGFIPYLRDALPLIQQLENPNIKAAALSVVAHDLAARGDYRDLPSLVAEIREYLQLRGDDVNTSDVDTLNGFSLALGHIGQIAESQAIKNKLDAMCEARIMREFCSSRSYESGRLAALENTEEGATRAVAAFTRSLTLASEINDKRRPALSYYGLIEAHRQLKNYDQAIQYAKQAHEMLVALDLKDWAASALRILSKVYVDMGRYQEGLEAAEKALIECPEEFKIDRARIYQQLAEVYEKVNRPWDALRSIKLKGDFEKELSVDDAQKKYMQLRNESLSTQNEMQAAQIHLLKKFQVVSIAAAFLSLLLIVAVILIARQARIVRASQQKMREILDHIAEGILTLDHKLQIRSGYSPFLDQIFGSSSESLTGKSFLEVIFPSDAPGDQETRNMAQAALASCIGEGSLSWELNKGHLPHETQYKGMSLVMHWQPLYNIQQNIISFLVSVRDVTQVQEMKQLAQNQERRVRLLQEKLQEILAGKSSMMRQLLKQIMDECNQLRTVNKVQSLRRLHTFKGAARTLGLKQLAAQVHEMETHLQQGSATDESWEDFQTVIADYDHLLNSLMSAKSSEEHTAADLYGYASLYAEEAEERLKNAGKSFFGLRVLDQIRSWDPKTLGQIHEVILHAISNAVDHGFLRAAKNQSMQPALIEIEAIQQEQSIKLTINDNGAGIDLEVVREKAQALDFTPRENRPLTDILFLDGVSTAASVSSTSGRGVGLSAILGICKDLDAVPEINNRAVGGTQLTVILPANVGKNPRNYPLSG